MKILESYTAKYYGVSVQPHDHTQRLSITPPGTRKYHVTHIMLHLYRTEAATAQGFTQAYVLLFRGNEPPCSIAIADLYGTEVGTKENVTLMTDITIYPGDSLRAYTVDTSTGGAISYWITVNYDAIP